MEKKIFKIINIVIYFFVLISVVNSTSLNEDVYFNFNNFEVFDDLETNKVYYSVKVDNNEDYKFEMNYYFKDDINKDEGVLIDTCVKEIFLESDEIFQKIICNVEKKGNGEYIFDAKLIKKNDSNVINLIERVYLLDDVQSKMKFKIYENETQVFINILGDSKDVILRHKIPKTVIEYLDNNNKDDLIYSVENYQIIDPDPIIAWNVDDVPKTINYTIKKRISEEDRKKFEVEIANKKSFQYLKFLTFGLILVIILIIFIPWFKKNKNVKK